MGRDDTDYYFALGGQDAGAVHAPAGDYVDSRLLTSDEVGCLPLEPEEASLRFEVVCATNNLRSP